VCRGEGTSENVKVGLFVEIRLFVIIVVVVVVVVCSEL
jgi:hypothetical protein